MANILERSLIMEVLLWMDNVVVGIHRQKNHNFLIYLTSFYNLKMC
jgi:hypothetical protein